VLQAKAKLASTSRKLVKLEALASSFDKPEFERAALDIADRGITLLATSNIFFRSTRQSPSVRCWSPSSGDPDAYPRRPPP